MGICCFSTLDDNILLWSYYSDGHKGICLKFDTTEDVVVFKELVVVSYEKELRHYNHFLDSKKSADYFIKPKSLKWSHESEIRIVKTKYDIIENENKRTFKFRSQALKEIIFGKNTPDCIIREYKQLCIKHNKEHVKFYKMQLGSEDNFQLIKIPI